MAKFKDLTREEVGTIVDWYDRGLYSQRELAEIFEVSRATIRRAVNTTDRSIYYENPEVWPTSPEVGYFEEVGQPTEPEVGEENGPLGRFQTWVEIGAAVAALVLAGWVGYIIYTVYN